MNATVNHAHIVSTSHRFSWYRYGRPGKRGALLWFRTGSDVVIPNAFRLLSIPTTA